MSVRKKILVIIICTLAALFLLVYTFSETFLLNRFSDIERQDVQKDTKRALEAYNNTLLDLSTKIHDWSSWDDTYKFIQDTNSAYVKSNLNNSSLADLNVNFIIFVNSSGKIVMSKYINLSTQKDSPLPSSFIPYITDGSSILHFSSVDDVKQGVILLPEGPLLVSARPITKSDHSGPIRGTVIFGRFLDKSIVAHIADVTHLSLIVQRYDQKSPTKTSVVIPLNDGTIAGYSVINDITNKPALLLRITENRVIYQQGKDTIFTYLFLIGILGSVISLIFFLMVQNTVRELQKAKAKDDAILESIGNGLIITDNEGKILLANSFAGELLGTYVSEMLGKELFAVVQASDIEGKLLPRESSPLLIALHSHTKVQKDIVITKHGQQFTFGIIATPIMQDRQIIGAIGTIRDITKEKAVDRAKTEFISLAAHQLRTPLSAVKWFSEMLADSDAGTLNDEQLDFAKNINASTNRMIELINSLLNITRMESGRMLVQPEPTDLRELVDSVIKELQIRYGEKKQQFAITVADNVPKINIDTKLIRQVYINMLTNAIKYSPPGSIIKIALSVKDDEIVAEIADPGYGIPEAVQSKVFDKFFRGDNVAKKETDGTGLGLYLIKSILDSIHGKVWFESKEGKGSTFWFTIPLSGMKPKKGEVTLNT